MFLLIGAGCGGSDTGPLSTDTSCTEILDTYDIDTDRGLLAFNEDLARLNGGSITLDRPTLALGFCRLNPGWTLGLALSQDSNVFTDESLFDDPLARANNDPAETTTTVEIAPSDVGTARFEVTVTNPDEAFAAAKALDTALSGYDSTPAEVDGARASAEITNITYAAAQAIDLNVLTSNLIALRPVVALQDFEDAGNELIATRDDLALAVGPSQGDQSVFGFAEATQGEVGGWGLVIEIRDEVVWNSLATQCFNGAPTCPSTTPGTPGQLAIVVNNEVISAPAVNTPIFEDEITITGSFTESEAIELASTINAANTSFEETSQSFAFIPN